MLGSILSNILLVLGMSFFVGEMLEASVSQFVLNSFLGGLYKQENHFAQTAAQK
jgi:hypothetical protein